MKQIKTWTKPERTEISCEFTCIFKNIHPAFVVSPEPTLPTDKELVLNGKQNSKSQFKGKKEKNDGVSKCSL
jgi:hypothetical protein